MTKILTGKAVAEQASMVCSSKGEIFLAVSYWGKGATEALKLAARAADVRVVLNVDHGGTNPEELEALMTTLPGRVRVHTTLHSKIYASERKAVLGSANASASGLNWEGMGHAEAAVVMEGANAVTALELAKKFYEEGQNATDEHLDTCRMRFGRRSLAATLTETPKPKSRAETANTVGTFLYRSDVFGPMPVIISKGEADPHVLEKDWNDQRTTAEELPENAPFNQTEWSYFQWHLDDRYRGKACVEIHKGKDDHLSLHAIQPIFHKGTEGTFARRLSWPIVGDLGQYWHGMVRNVGSDEELSRVHEALSERDYLTGWDVYAAYRDTNTA